MINSLLEGRSLMDLHKAFDCVPNNLLILKLGAYGFGISFLCYIYSYIINRKQWIRTNKNTSSLDIILSAVTQG